MLGKKTKKDKCFPSPLCGTEPAPSSVLNTGFQGWKPLWVSSLPAALGSGPPPSCTAPCQGQFWELSPCPSTERKWGRFRVDFSAWQWCVLYFYHYCFKGTSDQQPLGARDWGAPPESTGGFSELVTDSGRRRWASPSLPRRTMLRAKRDRTSTPQHVP